MASFEIAYQIVADHEGGYQNNPNDSGNYNSIGQLIGTNWGISAPVYESFLGYPPTQADMQSMTASTAKAIYKQRFWDVIKGDQINNQQIANILFDGRVNHGSFGVVLMQRILGVEDDGVVGPITLNAINSANPQLLFNEYKNARADFYNYLVVQDPTQGVFLNGWLARINSFNYIAMGGGALATIALLLLMNSEWLN